MVITHRVSIEKQAQYEEWLNEIGPIAKASEGLLDLHVVRPVRGVTETYSIIIRYDSEQNLRNWMESDVRNQLIAKVQDLLIGKDEYRIQSGLDFWFMPEGQGQDSRAVEAVLDHLVSYLSAGAGRAARISCCIALAGGTGKPLCRCPVRYGSHRVPDGVRRNASLYQARAELTIQIAECRRAKLCSRLLMDI